MNIVIANLTVLPEESCGKSSVYFSQLAKDYLTAVNNNALTTLQKDALNTFVQGLEDNSLLSKITRLYLPVFAGDIAKTFINLANDMSNDLSPNASYFGVEANKGIKALSTGNALILPISGDGLTDNDFHFFSFTFNTAILKGNAALYNSSQASSVRMQMGTQFQLDKTNGYVADRNFAELASNPFMQANDATGLYGFSLKNNEMIGGDGDVYVLNNNTVTGISTDPSLCGYNDTYMIEPNAILSVGHGLTQAEFTTYKGLMDALITSLGGDA